MDERVIEAIDAAMREIRHEHDILHDNVRGCPKCALSMARAALADRERDEAEKAFCDAWARLSDKGLETLEAKSWGVVTEDMAVLCAFWDASDAMLAARS